jgi:signal transduction histidine kinase
VQNEWFDVNRLVETIIDQLRKGPHVLTAGRIRREIADHLACWGDRQQIQTMLCHLLENACAAVESNSGGIVVAAEERDTGTLRMEVRDQGPGIAPELRDKVCTPFFSSRPDGTGLGLAIVLQIVDNHHGTLEIADNPPRGCLIRLDLPQPATP